MVHPGVRPMVSLRIISVYISMYAFGRTHHRLSTAGCAPIRTQMSPAPAPAMSSLLPLALLVALAYNPVSRSATTPPAAVDLPTIAHAVGGTIAPDALIETYDQMLTHHRYHHPSADHLPRVRYHFGEGPMPPCTSSGSPTQYLVNADGATLPHIPQTLDQCGIPSNGGRLRTHRFSRFRCLSRQHVKPVYEKTPQLDFWSLRYWISPVQLSETCILVDSNSVATLNLNLIHYDAVATSASVLTDQFSS